MVASLEAVDTYPQEGKAVVKKANEYKQSPSSRPFMLDEVSAVSKSVSTLERSYLVLTSPEYQKAFGAAPRSKDPKVATLRMKMADQSTETLYVFKDESQPWRRLCISHSLGEERSTLMMPYQSHCHAEQGALTHKAALALRLKESGEAAIVSAQGLGNPSTLSEFKAKMDKRWSAREKQATDVEIEDEKSDSDMESDQDGSKADSSGAASDEKNEKLEVKDESKSLIEGVVPENLGSRLAAVAMRPPGITKKASSRSLGAASLKDDDDDDASTLPDVEDSTLPHEELIQKWIEKLPLKDIAWGIKKGVFIFHAKKSVKKVEPQYGLRLRAHLRLCEKAALLSPKEIGTASWSEILEAAAELKGHTFAYHPDTQKACWKHMKDEEVKALQVPFQSEQMQQLMIMIKPYNLSGQEGGFDLSNPVLSQSDLATTTKTQLFTQCVLADVLVPKLMLGEQQHTYVQQLATFVIEDVTEDLVRELDEAVVKCLVTMLEIMRGIRGLFLQDVSQRLACKEWVENLRLKKGSVAAWGVVASAVDSTAFYLDKVLAFRKEVAAMGVRQNSLVMLHNFSQQKVPSASEPDLEALIKCLQVLCTMEEELPASVVKTHKQHFLDLVISTWASCKSMLGSASVAPALSTKMGSMLSEAAITYPHAQEIADARAEFAQVLAEKQELDTSQCSWKASWWLPNTWSRRTSWTISRMPRRRLCNAKGSKCQQMQWRSSWCHLWSIV